jgi:hypothetical protein
VKLLVDIAEKADAESASERSYYDYAQSLLRLVGTGGGHYIAYLSPMLRMFEKQIYGVLGTNLASMRTTLWRDFRGIEARLLGQKYEADGVDHGSAS